MSKEHKLPWRGVPVDKATEWDNIFYLSREGLSLSAPCPVCNKQELHRYYQAVERKTCQIGEQIFIANGACWQWCSNCRSYVHLSALVPSWWSCDLVVDESKLTAEPEAIEEARLKHISGMEYGNK